MKAIILAGGSGTRLYPLTKISSKQLQPIFDKPMIYYSITVLIAAGIQDFCIIATRSDIPKFKSLLKNGKQWGVTFEYRIQDTPDGIAQAFLIAEEFIGDENVVLMLGDNIFSGGDDFPSAMDGFSSGATVFAYHVKNPEQYGVIEFDSNGKALSIEEKPKYPKSNYAIPGLYIYDNQVIEIARNLSPSERGELEITDVNIEYMKRNQLHVKRLSRGFAWIDAGTSTALHEASMYVETIERRQGIKIGCPEEAALIRGFLTLDQFDALVEEIPNCEYRNYLVKVASDVRKSSLIVNK